MEWNKEGMKEWNGMEGMEWNGGMEGMEIGLSNTSGAVLSISCPTLITVFLSLSITFNKYSEQFDQHLVSMQFRGKSIGTVIAVLSVRTWFVSFPDCKDMNPAMSPALIL